MLRIVALLVLAAAVVAGGATWRDRVRTTALEESVAARRELRATRLAPEGAAPQAGVSARAPIRVKPLPKSLARQLHGDPDFHRLSHRCGVCHTTPDPALHSAADWPATVSRMAGTMDAAGLLPLSAADREAVLRVLRQHSQP
jgi:hypothetical protein